MNWQLLFRALWLRGGIVLLVAFHDRVMPRRLPGPRFLSRWAIKLNSKRQGGVGRQAGLPTAEQMSGPIPTSGHLMYLKNKGDQLVRAILESTRSSTAKRAVGVRRSVTCANDQPCDRPEEPPHGLRQKLELSRAN
jgi:hypothetical protein